jgi:hypothetical protein
MICTDLSEDDLLLQTTTRSLLAPLARPVFRPVIEGRETSRGVAR